MELEIRGTLLSNDMADIYRWFGWRDLTCPSDITAKIAECPADENITVLINSPGGDMTVGSELCSVFRRRGNCRAVVQGYAASAATIAMMGCTHISAEPSALLCYHNPSINEEGTGALFYMPAKVQKMPATQSSICMLPGEEVTAQR